MDEDDPAAPLIIPRHPTPSRAKCAAKCAVRNEGATTKMGASLALRYCRSAAACHPSGGATVASLALSSSIVMLVPLSLELASLPLRRYRSIQRGSFVRSSVFGLTAPAAERAALRIRRRLPPSSAPTASAALSGVAKFASTDACYNTEKNHWMMRMQLSLLSATYTVPLVALTATPVGM